MAHGKRNRAKDSTINLAPFFAICPSVMSRLTSDGRSERTDDAFLKMTGAANKAEHTISAVRCEEARRCGGAVVLT